jgi:lipid A ethanolaminephosphotransferase
VQFKPFAREFSLRVLSLVLAIVVLAGFSLAEYKDITLIGRNHAELRMFINPSYAIYSAVSYLRHRNHRAGVSPIATDARQVKPVQEKKRTVVILVVGETARASQFSLNGYERQTNQYLQQDDVISFTQTYACGTSTAYSLPCMFSHLGRNGYSPEKAAEYENVLDVLAHAGVSVLWRDNNSGCKGICSRVVMEDMALEGMKGVPDLCKTGECFDEVLLHKLKDRIRQTDSDMLIILHQKGSHGPAYSRRHPGSFSRYIPECTSNSPQDCDIGQIVNAYDNTISYTDYVLHRTITLLKQETDINTLMMYFSDHGESLGENGIFLHGLPYMIAPDEQKHIPFVLWMSDGFGRSRGIDKNCLSGRRDQPYSHDNIFHSLLGAFSVQTGLYRQEQDILAQCRTNPAW